MIRRVGYGDVQYFEMGRPRLGVTLRTTGVYLIEGLLIDTGCRNLSREFEHLVRELPVCQVVNTHHHEDHVGNNRLLVERFGLTPRASQKAIARLQQPWRLEFYRRLVWGTPSPMLAEPLPASVETIQFHFRVIETPGHSEDHVCLFEDERGWLFSGDLYLGSRLKYLRADEDVYALLASLEKVAAVEPERMFCAHRGEVARPRQALRRKIENLQELGEQIRELGRAGFDPREITRHLFPAPDFIEILSRGHLSRANFVAAFLRPQPAG